MMVQENTASFPHARKWRWLRGGMIGYFFVASLVFLPVMLVYWAFFILWESPQPGDPPEWRHDLIIPYGYLKDYLPADLSDLAGGYSGGIIGCYLGVLALLAVQSPAWLGLAGCRLYWSHLVGPWISDPPGIGVWFLRQMAIAYLGIVTGIIITLYGLNLYLAINNPDFVWGIWDQIFVIFVIFWGHFFLITSSLIVQAPGWLGLWLLHNPVNGSGKTARRPETRWEYHLRRGAIGYLIVSVIGVLILAFLGAGIDYEGYHPDFFSQFSVKQDLFSLDTLWQFLIFSVKGFLLGGPILLLIQSPGWAILWWGWYQRRGVTMGQLVRGWGFNLWRKGVVGILWMSVAAAITLRSNLDHLARYDFETAYVPQDIPDFMGTVWLVVMGIQATGWLFLWQSRPGLRGNSPMRVT